MYRLIEIPKFSSHKKESNFSKKEAEQYFNWFQSIREERVEYLLRKLGAKSVKLVPDFSRKTLQHINSYLLQNIRFRSITDVEIADFNEQLENTDLLKKVISIPNHSLTDETVSLVFDVGLYFGECIIKNVKNKYHWGYSLKPKNYIHYGQPILLANHPADNINPRFLIESKILYAKDNHIDIPQTFLVDAYDYCLEG